MDSLSNISVSRSAFPSFAPVCNPVYKIAFPVPFPAYSFLSPRRVGAFAGPSRLCSCVAGRKARKNRRCFVLSLGPSCIQVLFFRDGRRRPFRPGVQSCIQDCFPCSFPGVFFSFTQKSRSVCRAVPPMQLRRRAQSAQKQTLFRLIFGAILYTGSFFSGRTPPPALAAAFWGRSEGGLFAESAVLPFFSACKCLPEALPPLDSPPELRPPPLYTARPICWLTFPLGSDTISIKHRKGRPARSEGGLSAESAVRPFFSACKCLPEDLPPLDSPPELRPPPSLYTARPICWLSFPLGSYTISIKHRTGRPAPWPSS